MSKCRLGSAIGSVKAEDAGIQATGPCQRCMSKVS